MPLTMSVPTLGQVVNTATPLTVNAGVDIGGLAGPLGGAGVTATVADPTIDNNGQIASTGLLDNLGALVPGTADAVDLQLGGTVNNGADAVIDGTANGITVTGGAGTINNSTATSEITGAADGIAMTAGGTVTNTAGTVTGALDGVSITGTPVGMPSVITNSGTISATAPGGIGVALDTGALTNGGTIAALNAGGIGADIGTGSATNDVGGVITGALDGVSMATRGTVDNLGTISTTGPNGIGVNLLNGGVVIDAGMISGSDAAGNPGGVAVNLGGSGGSTLVLDPGAVLNGVAQAAGTGNTLEIAAGAGPVSLADIGTTVTGFGTTDLDAGASLDVANGITAPGTVTLGNGSSLTVGGPVAAGVDVGLGAGNATLTLADPSAFAGSIQNLGTTDTLDLDGLGVGTTVSYAPGTGLTITATTGTTSIIPVTLPAGVSLGLTPDGLGVTVSASGTGSSVIVGGGTPSGGGSTSGGTTTTGGGTGGGGTGGGGTGGGTTTTGGGTGGDGTGGGGTGGGGTGGGTTTTGGGTSGGGTTVTTDPTSGATTTTVSGTGGNTAVTTTPGAGNITAISTTLLGNTSSLVLPLGSAISQGVGAAAGDLVSVDPSAAFNGKGRFTITGHVASTSGVTSVGISAVVDGAAPTLLGEATVAPDGSYSFVDKVGPHLQGFITATETDASGNTNSVQAPYSLQAGLEGTGKVAQEVLYNRHGSAVIGTTNIHRDGSSTVNIGASGKDFESQFFDTFNNHGAPNNTFVFNPGHGLDTINLFRANGADHDTISLPSADFANLAAVIGATHNVSGSAVIVDPTSGDTLKLTGVSKAELKANPSDFSFHV